MEEIAQIEEEILKTTNFLSKAYLDNYQKLENKFKRNNRTNRAIYARRNRPSSTNARSR